MPLKARFRERTALARSPRPAGEVGGGYPEPAPRAAVGASACNFILLARFLCLLNRLLTAASVSIWLQAYPLSGQCLLRGVPCIPSERLRNKPLMPNGLCLVAASLSWDGTAGPLSMSMMAPSAPNP